MDFFLVGEGPLTPAHAVAALILVDDGRYLMQLRDQKAGIFSGHWGLFGGAIEPGESPEAALHRELQEELRLIAPNIKHVTDFSFTFGRFGQITRYYFEVAIGSTSFGKLQLHEGSEMRTFLPSEILNLPRVVPYVSFAIWFHAICIFDRQITD